MSQETHATEIEEESIGHDERTTADLGEDSVGHVPEATEEYVDEPDTDLATETPLEDEPAESTATEPEIEEVEEHPDVSKEALEREIAELKEKRRLAQEKYEYWRDATKEARAAHFQGRDIEEPPARVPETPVAMPPKEEDFDSYNDYVDALTDFKVTQKLTEYERETQLRAADEAHARKRRELSEKLEQGPEKYSDFEEVVRDPIVPITEMIVDILADSERPADVAYYLGKNLSEATQISRMPPLAAARAIGVIEAKIMADETKETEVVKPPVPKKTTSAPAPITPVKVGTATVTKDPSKMTNEEYRAWRRKDKK